MNAPYVDVYQSPLRNSPFSNLEKCESSDQRSLIDAKRSRDSENLVDLIVPVSSVVGRRCILGML